MSDCAEPERSKCPRLCIDFCNKAETQKIMSDTPRTDDHVLIHIEQDYLYRFNRLILFTHELERELNAAKAGRCDWKEDMDGNWDTSCKQCMSFDYDPPIKQGYKFCHHCGAIINFIKFEIDNHEI